MTATAASERWSYDQSEFSIFHAVSFSNLFMSLSMLFKPVSKKVLSDVSIPIFLKIFSGLMEPPLLKTVRFFCVVFISFPIFKKSSADNLSVSVRIHIEKIPDMRPLNKKISVVFFQIHRIAKYAFMCLFIKIAISFFASRPCALIFW